VAGRLSNPEESAWARLDSLARAVITYWALFGGLILVALVFLTATSALMNLVVGRPILGDFELTKHGVAIAAFAFLPYCQLTYANVTVDIFTERMSDRAKSIMVLIASSIALVLAVVLFRQMWLGMRDYIQYPESMVSIPIPLWTAFPPALVSLALLAVASVMTAGEALRGVRIGKPTQE
jgi:TRAP-type C4-dicarboxylate transport system permease small subunit